MQLPHILGIRGVSGHTAIAIVSDIWQYLAGVHLPTVLLSCLWLGLLVSVRILARVWTVLQPLRTTGPLLLSVVAISMSWNANLSAHGVQVSTSHSKNI